MKLMNLTLPFHDSKDSNVLPFFAHAWQPHGSPVSTVKSLQVTGNSKNASFAPRIINRKYRGEKSFQKAGNETKWAFCLSVSSVIKVHREAGNISAHLPDILLS